MPKVYSMCALKSKIKTNSNRIANIYTDDIVKKTQSQMVPDTN